MDWFIVHWYATRPSDPDFYQKGRQSVQAYDAWDAAVVVRFDVRADYPDFEDIEIETDVYYSGMWGD